MPKSDVLIYEKECNGRVVILTMNRPKRMNALNTEMSSALKNAWERFRDDEEAWVAILTGAGDAFCAGRDLKEDSHNQETKNLWNTPWITRPSLSEFLSLWKPTIAAINGYAIAAGWIMAQNCDIRLAAEDTKMGIAEVKWNMPAGPVYQLTRQLHLQHAIEIVLWGGRWITAQRAYEIGWVNRVVPGERLMSEAMKWAKQMIELAPRDVQNLKEILYRSYYMGSVEGAAFATAVEKNLVGMEDSVEGRCAFIENRKPHFRNK